MAQCIKLLAWQTLQLKFNPWNPCKGGKREMTLPVINFSLHTEAVAHTTLTRITYAHN